MFNYFNLKYFNSDLMPNDERINYIKVDVLIKPRKIDKLNNLNNK
jgi:hypothetical protein